jgi:hypothetical protein
MEDGSKFKISQLREFSHQKDGILQNEPHDLDCDQSIVLYIFMCLFFFLHAALLLQQSAELAWLMI